MVVVIVIGVLSALAIPSLRLAIYDCHAYQDAGAIMQLFREARMRSVARGSAVLVSLDVQSTRGLVNLYEAVEQDPNDASGKLNRPVATCRAPMAWSWPATGAVTNGKGMNFVDGIALNGTPETDADIETAIYVYTAANGTTAPAASTPPVFLCYTPLGRSYLTSTNPPSFNGQMPTTSVIAVSITRGAAPGVGTLRSVIVEPNGMPRLLSKVL